MAILTSAKRKAMPQSDYALSGKRFPVKGTGSVANDRSHAGNAKARAAQGLKAGTLSAGQAAKIDAAANKVLGKGKKK